MCSLNINRLESFSDEILLDIFEYLDAYNLYQAFYGLNHRINNLLKTANLYILYDSTKEDETVWNTLVSFVNPLQIRILSSYNNININEQFISSIKKNLYSLCLYEKDLEAMDKIFQQFPNNNQLKCLNVQVRINYTSNARSIADLILIDHSHRFVSLVNLSLSFSYYINNFPVGSVIFSQLRHLSINNCYLSTNLIQFLHNNTPNLRSLKVITGYIYSPNLHPEIFIKHVHNLHINNFQTWIDLKNILYIFPCLRRLHIQWIQARWCETINGTQWQEFFQEHLPHLKQFTIDFGEGIEGGQFLESFYTGDFWSRKKIKMKMVTNKTISRYPLIKTIYFGKQWHFKQTLNL